MSVTYESCLSSDSCRVLPLARHFATGLHSNECNLRELSFERLLLCVFCWHVTPMGRSRSAQNFHGENNGKYRLTR
eukprot:4160050-Amphidinium_carterae.1